MRTLNRYLTASFLVTFGMSVLVVTFVMCIGIMFKLTDLIARGVSWQPLLKILLVSFPQALTYSIPISVMIACLLVFGRLSADGEVTAMKASGVNVWNIVQPPCLAAAVLSVVCIVVNNEFVPRGHLAGRQLMVELGLQNPIELLEEGRFIEDFPGMTVYVGKRKDDQLTNIRIYDLRNPKIRREIRASSGTVHADDTGALRLELFDVRIDPFADDRPGAAYCESWTVSMPQESRRRVYKPDKDDMSLAELLRNIRNVATYHPNLSRDDRMRQQTQLRVELHKRLSLGAACFAFAVLGVPLGIKAHRKESSVGVGMSLMIVVFYYLFIIMAESLDKQPAAQPHMIIWAPILIALLIGSRLVDRNN